MNHIFLWNEWIQIGQTTRDTIRVEGFHEEVNELLMDRIIGLRLSRASDELAEDLVDYVVAESEGIAYEKRLLGSTEALEGLFGVYKRMAGDNKVSENGLTRLILCMSSRIGELSEKLVHQALTGVKCKDVENWLTQAFSYISLEEKQERPQESRACNF